MHTAAKGGHWNFVWLIPVLFFQVCSASAVPNAEIVTQDEIMAQGSSGSWMKLAISSESGHKILKGADNNLWLPGPTSLRITVTCGNIPTDCKVTGIDISAGDTGVGFEDLSGNNSVSWTASNFFLNGTMARFSTIDATGTFENTKTHSKWQINCGYVLHRPRFFVSAHLSTDPEDPYAGGGAFLEHATTEKDVFNATYKINAVRATEEYVDFHPDLIPVPGALVQVWYEDAPWKSTEVTTDVNGNATAVLGSGGPLTLEAEAGLPSPALYMLVNALDKTADSPCNGYAERLYVLPQYARLAGALVVRTRDMDGHPLPSLVTVWGGPFWPYSVAGHGDNTEAWGKTDATGFVQLKINPREETEGLELKEFEVKLAPMVNLEKIYTQLVDSPTTLVEALPCYISPRFTLHPNAYTYADNGREPVYCTGGKLQLLDDDTGAVRHEESIEIGFSRPDSLKRRDRKFLPVPVTREGKDYRTRVVFDCPDGVYEDDKQIVSDEPRYYVRTLLEPLHPWPYTIEVVTCAVGAWSNDEEGAFPLRVPPELLDLQTGTFNEMFPGEVAFIQGGTIQLHFLPFQSGKVATWILARELQERQRATPGVDKVIGLVPPGWMDDLLPAPLGSATPGLQIEGVPGAIMLDLAQVKEMGALHEFLHTLDLLDVKRGNYLGVPDDRPPSANGYNAGSHREILNLAGHATQTARVMYEFTNDHTYPPWLHMNEYGTLINSLYKQITPSANTPLLPAASKSAPAQRMRMHGYFNLNGSQAVLDPVFTDFGEPYNSYPVTPQPANTFFLELLDAGQSRLGIYYIPVAPPKIHVPPTPGVATAIEDVSLESRFSAAFDLGVSEAGTLATIRMGYSAVGSAPAIWKTITVSPNAPAIQWASVPAGTVSESTDIAWSTVDQDSGDVPLAHELYLSSNAGGTWRQLANHIPYRLEDAQRVYHYRFNPANWPSGNAYRFKVLASDGLRTSQLASEANVTVNGYDPNPKVELLTDKWEASRPEKGAFTVLVPLRNTGHGKLAVWADPATLPAWLAQTDFGPTKVNPMSDGLLLLNGEQSGVGTFEVTVHLNTNDPATPILALPVKLVQGSESLAPRIARIALSPDYPASRPWQPGETVQLTVWDNDCRPTMNAFVTVNLLSSSKTALITDLPMEPGTLAGEYNIHWTIPADAADGQYGLEFTLRDPAASLDAKDATHTLNVKRFTMGQHEDRYVMVPNVEGQTQVAATATLTGENLTVGTITEQSSATVPAGIVIGQSPVENESILAGSAVTLTISSGLPKVSVPNVVGLTQGVADAWLAFATLHTGTVTQECSNTMSAGTVISQYPVAGELLAIGGYVSYAISTGPCTAEGETTEGEGNPPDTPAEAAHDLRSTFDAADTDHSGGLSEAEVMQVIPGLSPDLFAQLDANGDGQVTPGEINPLIPMEVTIQDLISAFATADADHSGGLSMAEASAAIPGLTEGQFAQLDTSGDGQLTLDELNKETNPGGCSCKKSSLTVDGLKERMADLFLLGLALTSLLVVRGRRP